MNRLRAALLVALAWPLAANDTMVTLGAGGLVPVKSTAIAMESEDLQISIRQISIRYVFRNKMNRDIDAVVAFPLPALDGGDLDNEPMRLPSKDPVNFVDFKLSVAGKPVRPSVEIRASFDGKDITDDLRALGLPLAVADKTFDAALKRLPADKRNQLEKDSWIECSGEPSHCGAYWTSHIRYYWTQHFPAGAAVTVQHSYRPVVGGSYIVRGDSGASSVKPYCGGETALAQIAQQQKRQPATSPADTVLNENTIQYILTTANNWSGPIGNFRLTITAEGPDDIVLTCMPGLKRVSPTRYELTQANFRPEKELELLILTRPNPNRNER